MIKSEDWELMRIAAKRTTYEKISNTYLLDTISEELLKRYKTVPNDRLKIDTLKYFTKALAVTKSHRDALLKVSGAPNPNLRTYTRKVLRKYYR